MKISSKDRDQARLVKGKKNDLVLGFVTFFQKNSLHKTRFFFGTVHEKQLTASLPTLIILEIDRFAAEIRRAKPLSVVGTTLRFESSSPRS